ncbi:hypothetical protein DMUE_6199, partial [Dictyocoela muelleri]
GKNDIIDFLLSNHVIPQEIICCHCASSMRLNFFNTGGNDRLAYRCVKRGCQKRKSLFRTNMGIVNYIKSIYFMMSSATYWQFKIWMNLSNATIMNIKKN